jgi:hypothetical protein
VLGPETTLFLEATLRLTDRMLPLPHKGRILWGLLIFNTIVALLVAYLCDHKDISGNRRHVGYRRKPSTCRLQGGKFMSETCPSCGENQLIDLGNHVKACPHCDQKDIEMLGQIKDWRGELEP